MSSVPPARSMRVGAEAWMCTDASYIADCRLQIADSRTADCRLGFLIDDWDWRLGLAIADWILEWRFAIGSRQSQSPIPNPQSTIQSPIDNENPQSPIVNPS